jgi:hypothetical protein
MECTLNPVFWEFNSHLSGIQSHDGSAFQYETIDKLGVNVAGECICASPDKIYQWPL